jgi:hypothetical protein
MKFHTTFATNGPPAKTLASTLAGDFRAHDATRVFGGVVLALAVGKPIGIILTTWAVAKTESWGAKLVFADGAVMRPLCWYRETRKSVPARDAGQGDRSRPGLSAQDADPAAERHKHHTVQLEIAS